MSLYSELKRRNVFRVAIAYLAGAWLLIEVAETIFPLYGFGDTPARIVVTLLAIGFPLFLVFSWVFEITPEGLKLEKDVKREQSITPQTGKRIDRLIIMLLITAVVYFAFDKFVLEPVRDTAMVKLTAEQARSGALTESFADKSIAVLPFVNMSDDAANEYFSDGISEEILNALAQVGELKVAGRTSSWMFKGKNEDLRTIGEALNVAHILEGSVRKSGDRLRITAQLIKVEDGYHLWSESFDRELTDVFAIQEDIANAILEQLKALLVGERARTIAIAKTNTEAYELYLLAKQRIYDRTEPTIQFAADLLDRVITLDPQYAPAYAQRGIATILLSNSSYGTIPNEEALMLGKRYLDKALDLDENLAEGLAGLGLYYAGQPGENHRAIEVLKKALAINPSLTDANNWLTVAYAFTGEHQRDALVVLEKMLERDPFYKPGLANLVVRYNAMGRTDKSWSLLERVQPFMPQDSLMLGLQGQTHLYEGHLAEALPLLEQAWWQNRFRLTRLSLGECLLMLHENDRAAVIDDPWVRVRALNRLGRQEEAYFLALEESGLGNVAPLFGFLSATGRSDELIAFLEARWPDIGQFEQAYPTSGSWGHDMMLDVAVAYSQSGEREKFEDALARVRSVHDKNIAMIGGSFFFAMNEAAYHALAGNSDAALEQLARAIDSGYIGSLRIADDRPEFVSLEGDASYEAIQARMIQHLNREREQLGLKPLDP